MTSITWAGLRCVQEPADILAPQNRTQGRCALYWDLTSPDSEVSRHAVPTVNMITAHKLDTLGPNLWTQFYLRKGHQNLGVPKKFR